MNRKPPGEAVSNNQAANSLTRLTCPLAQVGAIILFGSKSLKTRITVITFAIVLLGSWSLALLVSRLLERDMVQLLSNQQFSLATLLAKEIDQELAMRLDMLERVAIAAELPMQQGPAAIQAYVEARPVLHHLFNGGLVVYDREGLALASVPLGKGRVGTYLRDAELIARAIDRGHVTVGRAFLGERLDTPAFAMAAPIRDEHGGVVGIMVGEIELGLRNFMTETMSTPYGRTGGYLLIDRTAREIMLATDRRRIMEKLTPPGVHPVIDRFLDGHEGTAIMTNLLGQEVLVADKGIPSADWIISVVAPTEEVFAPIAAMKQRLLGMTLILTLIGAALTWWFIRRQFVPLEQGLQSLAVMRQPGQPLTPLPVAREDEIGQLIGAFNALIAEVEVREKALRESDDCLRSILATSLDGFWRVSEEGRLLEVNETYARMSGYTVDELVGMHVSQLVADESPSVAAERHAKILATGHLQFEDVHRRKDGSVWHMESSATYRAGGGGQVVAFIRDISARKRDEARLREAERKFTALVQQSLVGVYIIRDGDWLYINPQMARMFGYASPAECIASCHVSDLVAPESRELVAENLRRRLRGEVEQLNYGFTGLRKDGTRIAVEVFGSTLEYDGRPAVLGLVLDVSERKRAEAELERYRLQLEDLVLERTRDLAEARDRAESANRAKSAFLGSMSHELRTPLNHITGFAALLEQDVESPRGQARLEKLRASADALLRMINDILDYSRLEADQIVIEAVDFELLGLLDQVSRAHGPVAASKGLSLRMDISPALPHIVRGDHVRLAQVLGHLVGNAIKFSDQGEIKLRVLPDGALPPMLRFEVEDQGVGIPPERQAGMFQLFNQGDNSTTRRFGGTGLGLQLCKRLVNLMAGDIGFTSTPGLGSVFWFVVPLVSKGGAAGLAPAGLPVPGGSPGMDVSRLLGLLDDGDIEARALWGSNPTALVALLGDQAEAFSEAMSSYDFVLAGRLLRAALAGQSTPD